jgi:hypothetical protein
VPAGVVVRDEYDRDAESDDRDHGDREKRAQLPSNIEEEQAEANFGYRRRADDGVRELRSVDLFEISVTTSPANSATRVWAGSRRLILPRLPSWTRSSARGGE